MNGMAKKKKKVIVTVSGGFDPIHVGHVRLFERARALGDELVVILNNDNWLLKKKGHVFMPQEERKEIIEALRPVDRVILTKHAPDPSDMSVSRELGALQPNVFANGGDRDEADAANPKSSLCKDISTCKKMKIGMVFNVGDGGKIQSSSWLLNDFVSKIVKGKEKQGRKRLHGKD